MDHLPAGTVTVLFTDIEGSTQRWEHHPQIMKGAVERHDAIMREAIAANGGVVFRTEGDAFRAAFTTALPALSAAVQAQRALETEPWAPEIAPLRVRMALHVGAVEIRDGDYVGPSLNRVARLLSAAYGGQALLSLAAEQLVRDNLPPGITLRDMGEHRLNDLIRPERIFQVLAPGLPAEFPALKTLDSQLNNLPRQATALIGREREVGEVCALIQGPNVALVTLTGPGGTGKTRLALQVAAELLEDFSAGVWFVDLAPFTDDSMVLPAIAGVLGLKESADRSLNDTLRDYLRGKRALLVLDNFEQVVAAATQVSRLLSACPDLKVLATSRIPLRVSGEHEYPVPPLALPDPAHLPPLERLTQYEAVRLFIERAVAIRPDFEVTNENAPAVAEICVRLDGLPLAIELAAARIRLFPPQALLNRLSSRLKVLTGGGRDLPARQQTLRGAIEWSYDLLEEGEKQLFHRMAVFQGGRTFEALEAVCNFDGKLEVDLLEGTEGLVSKSLVQQREDGQGEPRFWMLETIQEFAREKLAESGEEEDLRRQHLTYYLIIAREAETHLAGTGQLEWLGRLEEEYANIRAALWWAREKGKMGDAEKGLKLAATMSRFWLILGKYREGRELLEGALASVPDPRVADQGAGAVESEDKELVRARGLALYAVGGIAHNQGDLSTARLNVEKALEMARYAGDQMLLAHCLEDLAMLAGMVGDYAQEQSLQEQSLAILRETEDKDAIATSLKNLGQTSQVQEDYARARSLYEQRLAIARETGNTSLVASVLGDMGSVALEEGDYTGAHSLYEQALALLREMGNRTGIAYCLYYLGLATDGGGNYQGAISLYKEGLAMHQEAEDRFGTALCLAGLGDWAGVRKGQTKNQRERAVRLLAASTVQLEAIGFVLRPRDRLRYERGLTGARAQLGDNTFDKAWGEGRALSLEQAIEYALEDA
jgi:predicted ATPase/class 3 adenylate cyclase